MAVGNLDTFVLAAKVVQIIVVKDVHHVVLGCLTSCSGRGAIIWVNRICKAKVATYVCTTLHM